MSENVSETSADEYGVLKLEELNPHVRRIEYAIRGPLHTRAEYIQLQLQQGINKPFHEVIYANIGDYQALGQKPLTFLRQVLAVCNYPQLLDSPEFPEDVKERARRIINGCDGQSIGSYCWLAGMETVRHDVASYISARDGGIPCDWNNIFLSQGSTDSIKFMLKLMMRPGCEKKAGVMVPVPQHPLYTAVFAEYDACQIPYHLDEEKGWSLDLSELQRAIDEARSYCVPRAIVIINPGNPTGQILSKECIQEIIRFAHKEKLFILADEVYQLNVHSERTVFHSFKKTLMEMPAEYHDLELASFMSASKGCTLECGYRGGWVEVLHLLDEASANMIKFLSAKLCPNILGQCVLEVLVNPPQPGEPSCESHMAEQNAIMAKVSQNARITIDALNRMEGLRCQDVQGALYVFPRIDLPSRAIEAAQALGQEPDVFYCSRLLEETGICVVPGSGFGQRKVTHHFRMTILPRTEQLREVLKRFEEFQSGFMSTYR